MRGSDRGARARTISNYPAHPLLCVALAPVHLPNNAPTAGATHAKEAAGRGGRGAAFTYVDRVVRTGLRARKGLFTDAEALSTRSAGANSPVPGFTPIINGFISRIRFAKKKKTDKSYFAG